MTGPQVGTCDTDFSTFLLSFGRCTTVNDDLHHYSVVAIQIFSPKPCRSSQAQQPCTLWDCFSQSISILQVLPTKASTQFDFGVISSTPFTSTKTDRLYGIIPQYCWNKGQELLTALNNFLLRAGTKWAAKVRAAVLLLGHPNLA